MLLTDLLAALVFFVLSYASFRASLTIHGSYVAPIGLFWGINLASLGFYHLRMLPFISLRVEAYVLIMMSFLSFGIGVLISSVILDFSRKDIQQNRGKALLDNRGISAFYYLTGVLGIIAWVYYITQIVPQGWSTELWRLQGTGKEEYIMPYKSGYLMMLNALVPPLFVLLVCRKHRISIASVFILVGALLALIFSGIKSYFMVGALVALLIFALIRPKSVNLSYLALFFLSTIGFMILYDRYVDVFGSRGFYGSRFTSGLHFLERPYLYISGSWAALSKIITIPPQPEIFGQASLEVLWKILGPGGLKILETRVSQYLPFVNIGPTVFNVYSLIGELYWEYGWFGPLSVCLILGGISQVLYVSVLRHRNWIRWIVYGVFAYGLLISFFLYYYRSTIIFLLIYVLSVGGLIRKISLLSLPRRDSQKRVFGL